MHIHLPIHPLTHTHTHTHTHNHSPINPLTPPPPGTPPAAPAWFDIPVADGSFDVTRLRWAPLPLTSQQKGDWRNPLTPGKTGGRGRDVSMLRLRGAGAEEEEGEEEGQEEGAVIMVALMSADHWCVCALDQ